jgi:hypothetical protein
VIAALLAYLPALLLTLVLEVLVVRALTPRGGRGRALRLCVALNLFTHPLATLLAARAGDQLLAIELLVGCCEWLGYLQLLPARWPRALALALAANAASIAAGIPLWLWLHGP